MPSARYFAVTTRHETRELDPTSTWEKLRPRLSAYGRLVWLVMVMFPSWLQPMCVDRAAIGAVNPANGLRLLVLFVWEQELDLDLQLPAGREFRSRSDVQALDASVHRLIADLE